MSAADKAIWVILRTRGRLGRVPGDLHHTDPVNGVSRTAQILTKTPNRAVLPVLLAGLKSSRPEVRAATIRAAIRRHERATHTLLIQQFTCLNESDRLVLGEAHRAMPHHAAPALKTAIVERDATLCKNACRI